MGRAIVRDANVFLFDEPLSNLDAKLRHQMRSEIRRIHKEYRTTSIYVTHDQVEAMSLGDRVVVMRNGYIEQQGTPMDIYLKPENIFVATFIGAPSMNMLDANLFPEFVDLEGQKLPLINGIDLDLAVSIKERKKIKLGIRPDFFMDEKHLEDKTRFTTIKDAHIDLIEPLGFDQELSIQVGTQSIKARLDLRTTAREDEKIDLCFDMKRAHFFDPETGENLFIK
jgi:multiple sugar transport system ATP-binding protein